MTGRFSRFDIGNRMINLLHDNLIRRRVLAEARCCVGTKEKEKYKKPDGNPKQIKVTDRQRF